MQDLDKFKNEMNLSGQNVYVGHRYVPKIFGEWDNTQIYEPLSIVQYQGASYTSRQYVPVGIDILNEDFWVITGNYNAQIEQYRQDVRNLQGEVQKDLDNFESNISDIAVNVKNFGAVGDGVTDDAPYIRQAYEHLKSIGGGVLYFPKPDVAYTLKSTVTSEGLNVGLIHDTDNINFKGAGMSTSLRAEVSMHSMIYTPNITQYTQFNDITLNANKVASYCFTGNNAAYNPYMTVANSTFRNAIEVAFHVKTFVTVFIKSIFNTSKTGLFIEGVDDNIATSTNVISCYANNNTEYGFRGRNLMYSTFSSTAVDNMENGIAYYISGQGLTFNAIGAEKVKQVFKTDMLRGFTFNSLFAFMIGSLNENAPTNYLLEFGSAVDGTMSGIHIRNIDERHVNYHLGLTGSAHGFENITILDNSIKPSTVFFVKNWQFESEPIKFLRGKEINRKTLKTVLPNDLQTELKTLNRLKISHELKYKIENGMTPPLENDYINHLEGKNQLIFEGDLNNRELVKIDTAYQQLRLINNAPLIIFRNITFTSTFDHTLAIRVIVDNSTVIFDNCYFETVGVRASHALTIKNNGKVYFINGSNILESALWHKQNGTDIYVDDTSEFIEKTVGE